MNNLHKLLLSTVEIANKNIVELLEHMDDQMQHQALEILCGVYQAPKVNDYKEMWVRCPHRTDMFKIVSYKWNPLKNKVEYEYKLHKTLKVSHNLDDEDLELFKQNLLNCKTRDEAEKLSVFSGPKTVYLPYGALTSTYDSSTYIEDWNEFEVLHELNYNLTF
jgi:hypothetical protein